MKIKEEIEIKIEKNRVYYFSLWQFSNISSLKSNKYI